MSKLFSLSVFIIGVFSYLFLEKSGAYLVALNIILYFLLSIIYKNDKLSSILFIYGIIFNIYLLPRFFFGLDIVYFSKYDEAYYYNKAIFINFIFISSLSFFLKPLPKSFKPIKYHQLFKKNDVIFILNIFILLIIIIYGYSGNNILSGYTYGDDDFGSKSIFTEYFIIFLLLSLIHARDNLKIYVYALALIMVVQSILYGSRVSALLILFVLFAIDHQNRFNLKQLYSLLFIGLMFMNALGMLRGGSFSIDLATLLRANDRPVMSSTQSNMFYGSVVFIGLVEDGLLDFYDRMKSLMGFISRIFLPTSWTFEEGSLSSYVRNFTSTGGGAHPASYFYIWFSWIGPVLLAYFLSRIINYYHSNHHGKLFYLFFIIFFATIPRWYGYDPAIIFKMGWITIAIYLFLNFLSITMKKSL